MDHHVILDGFGCRLRPVMIDDAQFIVDLRNQPFAKGRIHSTDVSVPKQKEWIQNYLKRTGDYYWIIESADDNVALGTVGFYDITDDHSEGMLGRFVVKPQMKFNIFAPFFLIYDYLFRSTETRRVILDVLASNSKVIRFQELYGSTRCRCVPSRYLDTEREVGAPLVWFEVTREMWVEIRNTWEPILASF